MESDREVKISITQSCAEEMDKANCIPSENAALPDSHQLEMIQSASSQLIPLGSEAKSVSGNVPEAVTEMKAMSGTEMLAQSSQAIIEELNNKRKQDKQMIEDFRTALEMHTRQACEQTEENLFRMYQEQSNLIEEKVQELYDTLDRINQLEREMTEFKKGLAVLHIDMNEN